MTDERIYPDLSDVATAEDVSVKSSGRFFAEYINWARIAAYLREHAPGWEPIAETGEDGTIIHKAPDGSCYLMMCFRNNTLGLTTHAVPHSIMDKALKAKKNPDSRDVSDAFVRGMCKAAALTFGLGWKLWSKADPMGRSDDEPAKLTTTAKAPPESAAVPFHSVEAAEAGIGRANDLEALEAVKGRLAVSKKNFTKVDVSHLSEAFKNRIYILSDPQGARE